MTSRKALNDLSNMVGEYYNNTREHRVAVNTIKEALERKEQLEKENQELREENSLLRKENHNLNVEIEFEKNSSLEIIKDNLNIKNAIEILNEIFEFEIKQRDGKYYIDYCIVLSNELIEENAIALKEVLGE